MPSPPQNPTQEGGGGGGKRMSARVSYRIFGLGGNSLDINKVRD